jgi:hypothetical protein
MLRLPATLANRFRPATDREIHSWSFGLVKAPRASPEASWEQQRETLEDQSIFGPLRDWECCCGKFQGLAFKNMICDRCGVKVTTRDVRRQRFGHIDFPFSVRHPLGVETDLLGALPVLPAGFREASGGRPLDAIYEDIVRAASAASASRADRVLAGLARLVEILLPVLTLADEWNLGEATVLAHGLALERRPLPDDCVCGQCGYPLGGLDVGFCPGCGRSL